ncbi:MAG: disulfide bond formation protein B [Dongiaceae bacterium]
MPTAALDSPRLAPALVLAAAAVALGTAFYAQYGAGLQPCILCIYQRYPYGVAIVLGLAGLALAGRPAALRLVLALAGLAFLASAAVAAFHVGVEQHWWQGTDACVGAIAPGLTIEELTAQLLAAPIVRCDEVPWSLLGVSIAGFNLLYASLAGAAALWAAARTGRA